MYSVFDPDLFTAGTLIGFCLALVVFWTVAHGRTLFASPPAWFLLLQALFFVGTMIVADLRSGVDQQWVLLMLGAFASFVAGCVLANAIFRFRVRDEIARFRTSPIVFDIEGRRLAILYAFALLCTVVGITFAVAVGYNVFMSSLKDFLAAGSEFDTSTYRTMRSSISTERYVAVGYATQFTGMLLPLVIYLLYIRADHTRRARDFVIVGALVLADLYFLTITGNRGWLLHAGLLFILIFSRLGPLPRKRATRGQLAVTGGLVVIAVAFYALSTTMMGRVSDGGGAGTLAEGLVQDLFDRVMGFQAKGELLIMRYFLGHPPVWGQEWLEGLATVLPGGGKAHGFGSELHAFLFQGDESGSLGLTIWGSYWYNWGALGTLAFALFTGIGMQSFTIWLVRGPRHVLRVVALFVAGYRMTSFHDPYSLLLEGCPTILLFYGICCVLAPRSASHVESRYRKASRLSVLQRRRYT